MSPTTSIPENPTALVTWKLNNSVLPVIDKKIPTADSTAVAIMLSSQIFVLFVNRGLISCHTAYHEATIA